MNLIIVYYHISVINGEIWMALTEKAYWDVAKCMDDGVAPHHDDIAIAMGQCDQVEACTSTYMLESLQEEADIVAKMRTFGFDLQKNAEFSAFMEGDDEPKVTICCECQFCGDKYSFPLPNNMLETDEENPLLKAFYCCCGDCELYSQRIDTLGIMECPCFEEL